MEKSIQDQHRQTDRDSGCACENAVIGGGFPAFRNIGNEDWELFDPALDGWKPD